LDNSNVLKPQEIYIEVEQKYIAYLITQDDVVDCLDFDSKFFLNKELKIIFESIKQLCSDKVNFEIDILFDYVKQKTNLVTRENLITIAESFTDFSNIEYVKSRIKENYLKQVSTKELLGNILLQTTDSGDLDLGKIKDFQNNLTDTILEIEGDEDILLTFEQVINTKYRKLLEDRNEGVGKRTLGLWYLDKAITYPGEAGDILTIAMRKGGGKTTLLLNICNALINRNIPVVYFCLDMGYITVMDRFMCIVEGMSNAELLQQDKEEHSKARIEAGLKKFEKIKNFILYPSGTISLKDFEAYIPKIKKMFRQSGVFKGDDDYFVAVFDTIDMVEDFSGVDAYGIKRGINKLSTIIKKHNIFCINANQINENQVRAKKPSKIESVDNLRFTKEDIEGGASYAARSRVVIIGTRPKEMKTSFFPDETELLELEEDIMKLYLDKQNDGTTGKIYPELLFDIFTFRLEPKGD